MRPTTILVTAALALLLASTLPGTLEGRQPAAGAKAGAAQPTASLTFTDVTAAAGIAFRHVSGAFGKKYLPETMGPGCAFVDLDNDGWLDIVLVSSTTWPGQPASRRARTVIYRNNGNGSFADVTAKAGIAPGAYGLGVTAADYDNDGFVDLYFTNLGPNTLYRNNGNGTFSDVTAKAGVGDPGFSASAAFFDYDRDGKLDLYVANYVQWSIDKDLHCTLDGKTKSYCTPESYKGQSGTLYHNLGNGTFEDVTRKAGLYDPASKALGVALIDYDTDGHLDLFVSNDTQPNRLYRNKGDGTFVDVAVRAGVAFNEAGVARAGMGVDAADYDGSGRQSLVIGNFSNETMSLYRNEGTGLFIDEAPAAAIAQPSLLTLTFAAFFFDADLDGRPDIFAANGHVADDIERVQQKVKYAEPPHLFRNLDGKRFKDIAPAAGPAMSKPVVARGAAYGDYDNDGDLDLLITENNGPARLLRNDGGNTNRSLRVRLEGTKSNRNGIGAVLTLTTDRGNTRTATLKTGSSYLSQSELVVTFGLGSDQRPKELQVKWPSGTVDKVPAPEPGRTLLIKEGQGAVTDGGPTPAGGTRTRPTASRS
jgi:hypothetical protein